MTPIQQIPVPEFSLLKTWRSGPDPARWDHFQDCFVGDIGRSVTLEQWVAAFYATLPFRLERWLIGRIVGKPSTAADVLALAAGSARSFSAWTVLTRESHQILLQDFQGRTRSWLAVGEPDQGRTRLYFGSGIAAVRDPTSGEGQMTWGFRALGGFHVLYSRVLLGSARRALQR